jgi:hypothetical protein
MFAIPTAGMMSQEAAGAGASECNKRSDLVPYSEAGTTASLWTENPEHLIMFVRVRM